MKGQSVKSSQESRAVAHSTTQGINAVQCYPAVAQFKGGKKTLGIQAPQQAQPNWCWAAACSVIVGQTQQFLANQFVGGRDEQFDPVNVLNTYLKFGSEKNGKIPWDTLVDEVDAGRPVILLFGPKKDAHYILVTGYDGNSNRDKNRKYVISDPDNGGNPQPLTSEELGNYRGNFIGYYLVI
ncbi:MAG: hypothetical protein FD123_3105 [Bacteroidetes bacterium]|nr:MAG: hypothetical protein FD123_3105 [Bacteroidota bacterium]